MSNDKMQTFLWGALISAVVGIYGFFIKHLIRHPDKEEIDKLWEEKQSVGKCDEIVKRIDQNHEEICKKLDRILDKIEK